MLLREAIMDALHNHDARHQAVLAAQAEEEEQLYEKFVVSYLCEKIQKEIISILDSNSIVSETLDIIVKFSSLARLGFDSAQVDRWLDHNGISYQRRYVDGTITYTLNIAKLRDGGN